MANRQLGGPVRGLSDRPCAPTPLALAALMPLVQRLLELRARLTLDTV